MHNMNEPAPGNHSHAHVGHDFSRINAIQQAARLLQAEAAGNTMAMRTYISAMTKTDREAAMMGLIKLRAGAGQLWAGGEDSAYDPTPSFAPEEHQSALLATAIIMEKASVGSGCCETHDGEILAAAVRLVNITAWLIIAKPQDMAYRWECLAEAMAPTRPYTRPPGQPVHVPGPRDRPEGI